MIGRMMDFWWCGHILSELLHCQSSGPYAAVNRRTINDIHHHVSLHNNNAVTLQNFKQILDLNATRRWSILVLKMPKGNSTFVTNERHWKEVRKCIIDSCLSQFFRPLEQTSLCTLLSWMPILLIIWGFSQAELDDKEIVHFEVVVRETSALQSHILWLTDKLEVIALPVKSFPDVQGDRSTNIW